MRLILTLFLLLGLVGCKSLQTKASTTDDATANWSAQQLYDAGKTAMNKHDWAGAIKQFESLEARYPYGTLAAQAQLDAAYANYKQGENAAAISAADEFIKLHPNNPHVDYAYYLKGLASFGHQPSVFDRVAPQNVAERDPKSLQEAYDAFKELVTRYPNSQYAPDARQRMTFLVNALAEHEISVAKYYETRGAWLAAVNRAKYVIENYPRTPAVEQALAIQVRGYQQLGLPQLANDAARVLRQNYPSSRYIRNPALA